MKTSLDKTVDFSFADKDALSPAEVHALVHMINEVYTEAEQGLFKPGILQRTTPQEILTLLECHELMLLTTQGEIKGCVQVKRTADNSLKIGMITIAPALKGQGYGKLMMQLIETHARSNGVDRLELELLTPRTWVQDHKDFLHRWYTRIGFKKVRVIPFERQDLLATECEFTLYAKPLT